MWVTICLKSNKGLCFDLRYADFFDIMLTRIDVYKPLRIFGNTAQDFQQITIAKDDFFLKKEMRITLVINDMAIDVVKKHVKNLNLSVHAPDGDVKLSVPHHMKAEEIKVFVTSKLPWIRKQQLKIEQRTPRDLAVPREFVTGESHYFVGEKHLIKVEQIHTGKQRVEINENSEMVMHIDRKKDWTSREKVMKAFYRSYLKQEIPVLIAKWQPIMDVIVLDWGVKQMKTRWGTCNPEARRIWLNLELGKYAADCLEYIVVHEMNHLRETKHSQLFYQLMDEFLPDWKERQEKLSRQLYQ